MGYSLGSHVLCLLAQAGLPVWMQLPVELRKLFHLPGKNFGNILPAGTQAGRHAIE